MSEQTNIEWATSTWNPWEGCTKVSPGCANCYAEARNRRDKLDNWGPGKPRRRTSATNWKLPRRWDDAFCENHGPELRLPRPRIFPSLCDWLDDEVPIEWLADFLLLIYDTPHLDWLLLTKRPENWRSRLAAALEWMRTPAGHTGAFIFVEDWLRTECPNIPANVWVGTSVEDQERANERIPALLQIPARLRFLSVEPLLGAVALRAVGKKQPQINALNGGWSVPRNGGRPLDGHRGIDWVTIGGESGPGARPCNIKWIRDIVQLCQFIPVPVFVKQLGAFAWFSEARPRTGKKFLHPKGGDMAEWPADLRVRQFPSIPHLS